MFKSFGTYMKKYFGGKDFTGLKKIIETKTKQDIADEKTNTQTLTKLKDVNLPAKLIYIPFFVLLYLPQLHSKQKTHIKNSLGITLFIVLTWCLFGIENTIQALAIFPIAYGIGYIERIGYKMPFVYELYETIFEKILGSVFGIFKKGEKLHKTEKKEKLIAKAPTKTSEKLETKS